MTPCSLCNGTGNRNYDVDLDDMVVDDISDEDCPDCGGTGRTGSSGTETTAAVIEPTGDET
jgi:DnaJ-class molecular chaperone